MKIIKNLFKNNEISNPDIRKLQIYSILILLTFSIFSLIFLHDTTIYSFDETYYMATSMNMTQSGNWFYPEYESTLRIQKPILFYWFIMIMYKILGINIFNARIISLVFSLLTANLIFKTAQLLLKDKKAKYYSVMVYFSLYMTLVYSRSAITDMCLTFFITLSIYCFLKLYFTENKLYSILSFASMGLALSVKGHLGFIIPFTVILIFCLFMERGKFFLKFKKLFSIQGILIFIILGMTWYFYMYVLYSGEYLQHIFGRETMSRVSHQLINYKNIKYYSIAFLRHLLPWSLLLITGILIKKEREKIFNYENKKETQFLFIWLLWILIFFTVFLQAHHSRYILSIVVPFSLLIGNYLAVIESKKIFKNINMTIFISFWLLLFSILLAGVIIILPGLKILALPLLYYKLYIIIIIILSTGIGVLIYSIIKQKTKLAVLIISFTFILSYLITIGLIIPEINPKPVNIFIKNHINKFNRDDIIITNNLKKPDRWRITIHRKKNINKFFMKSNINVIKNYFHKFKKTNEKIYFLSDLKTFEKFSVKFKTRFRLIEKQFKYKRNIKINKFFKKIKADKNNIKKFREYYGLFIYEK